MDSLQVRIEAHKFIDKELQGIVLGRGEEVTRAHMKLVDVYERHYNLRSHMGHDFASWEAQQHLQPIIYYLKEFYGGRK